MVNRIKQSLVEQLDHKGAKIEHFIQLVNDYVFYCKEEKKMQKDIRDRGITYESVSATGKKYEKDNPAVKAVIMYSRQKLAIIKELGLKTDNVFSEDYDKL